MTILNFLYFLKEQTKLYKKTQQMPNFYTERFYVMIKKDTSMEKKNPKKKRKEKGIMASVVLMRRLNALLCQNKQKNFCYFSKIFVQKNSSIYYLLANFKPLARQNAREISKPNATTILDLSSSIVKIC